MDISPKTKIKLELQTFIMILVFVFTVGGTYISLKNTQENIIEKLDTLTLLQEDMITKRDNDHKTIDNKLAFVDNYIIPTLDVLAKRVGLK